MSRHIDLRTVTDKELQKLNKDLIVEIQPSRYNFNAEPTYLSLFEADGEDLYVPFSYDSRYIRPERSALPSSAVPFVGELRSNQKEVRNEAINFLNQTGSVIIACQPGFGKTCLGLNISTKIKLRTMIICHRVVLIQQWQESIKKFCPSAKVHLITPSNIHLPEADFYIINAINVPKHTRRFYSSIGLLIVDECHLIVADKLSHCMRYVLPRYVIGLSATPYRNDGLDILLDMYFGKNKIIRKLFRHHIVYRVDTGLKPEVKLNRMGKVDWGSVIESQSSDENRNELIIDIVKFFPDRVFLILCKRVAQAEYLVERLKEEKEDVTSLIGKNQQYEQSSRILVGTAQKTGVGFDHPRLNALILAADIEQYFVQYLGRVFRREDTEPIIFDLVDNYSLLLKHFRTRAAVYLEHGGVIKNFHSEFPTFSAISK